MLELYYLKDADSICSNRAVMTLAEKGIEDYTHRLMSLVDGDQFSADYLALNPKAQVPTLVHDGAVIRESSIVCDYIDGLRDDPPLKPEGAEAVAHMREWIKDCDESGYQATATLNFVTKFRHAIPIEVMEMRWAKVTDIDRLHRQQSVIREGMESPYVMRAVGSWDRMMGKIDKTLADGRPWVMGDRLTLVETCYAPFIKILELTHLIDLWLDGRPHAQAWWDRLTARPSYALLDEYPGQREDMDAPHAKAGAECRAGLAEQLDRYRERFGTA
ncbi:MAG: glutathione S-transferase family protein [Bauldia litoralis]